jgi:hypothetical protein
MVFRFLQKCQLELLSIIHSPKIFKKSPFLKSPGLDPNNNNSFKSNQINQIT